MSCLVLSCLFCCFFFSLGYSFALSLSLSLSQDYVIGDPHCERHELLPTDTHLVVACDGLWDVVSDQEVCDALLAPGEDISVVVIIL